MKMSIDNGKKGIVIAGTLIADTFYKIDTYPGQGLLTNIREVSQDIGGSGNIIIDLAKLDETLQVTVSAIVGEDKAGRMLCDKLSKYPNINIENVVRKGSSSETLVMDAQDTKQRTFFFRPAASDDFDESYIDWEKMKGDIFHLEYLLLMARVDAPDEEFGTHGARILHDARKRGMKTSIDIVSEQSTRVRDIVTCALKYTDYCSVNEVEAEAVTGIEFVRNGMIDENKIESVLLDLAGKGVGTWAIIHSPKCSYGYDCINKTFERVPSLPLPKGYIKGNNGAGDAYCSGILYSACQGAGLKEAMGFAAACAACSLSETNGTDGMRSGKEVRELEKSLNN